MLLRDGATNGIQGRFGGEVEELFEDGDTLSYATSSSVTRVDSNDLPTGSGLESNLDPDRFATLLVLLRSFAASMPEFPRVQAREEWLLHRDR
jgi:hypothetical protein